MSIIFKITQKSIVLCNFPKIKPPSKGDFIYLLIFLYDDISILGFFLKKANFFISLSKNWSKRPIDF